MEGSDSNGRTRLHKKVSLKTRSLYLQSRTDRVLECMKFDHSLSPNKRQRAEILGHDPFTASPELKTLGNAIKCQTLLQPLAAHDEAATLPPQEVQLHLVPFPGWMPSPASLSLR